MIIRDAIKSDLEAIVAIYNSTIPSRIVTADTEPVTVASRLNWFDRASQTRPIWVVELDNKVVGWLSLQDFYGRSAYQQTAELSIYISPDYQRQGIGNMLLNKAILNCPNFGINILLGFIFAVNKPSLNLFYKYQFQQWGYLPKVAEIDGNSRDLVILGRNI